MLQFCIKCLILFILSIASVFSESGFRPDTSRGSMLYDDHCMQCHTQQIHWREKKIVTDWESLITQVDRWQHTAKLGWRQDDVRDVSLYLNEKYYHFP